MKSVNDRKAILVARKADLEARMHQVEEGLDSHGEKDWEELAVERADDEVLEDLGNAAAQEIRMIDAALARVEAGEYGFCVKCGNEIAAHRLDVLPATPFCADCAPH